MKIIKSELYIKKEAIWSLPVGDPGLPGQLTENDISKQYESPEEDSVDSQQGESEIDVNWQEFGAWYSEGGEQLPSLFLGRMGLTPIQITYTYSYDYNDNVSGDIKPIQIIDYKTKQTVADPYLIQSFADYYDEQIKSDIEMSEENSKTQRSSDNIPF